MSDNRSLRSRQLLTSGTSTYNVLLAARKQAFIDMHNADQDPPVEIDDMDADDDADVQLDTLQFMEQMGERLDA